MVSKFSDEDIKELYYVFDGWLKTSIEQIVEMHNSVKREVEFKLSPLESMLGKSVVVIDLTRNRCLDGLLMDFGNGYVKLEGKLGIHVIYIGPGFDVIESHDDEISGEVDIGTIE